MNLKISYKINLTNDSIIRSALKKNLEIKHVEDKKVRIIEELGVIHGKSRIDIAVINGLMHGYEIKSDKDTLQRLPEQMNMYNSVFDKVTLVVGKNHLFEAINIVPDWWGVILAKMNTDGSVIFNTIREEEKNPHQDNISIAKLLWRDEALKILEEMGEANGLYYKPRNTIYEKLSNICDINTICDKVRETIFNREGWRSDLLPELNDG